MKTAIILKGYVRELNDRIELCISEYGEDRVTETIGVIGGKYKSYEHTEEVENLERIKSIIEDDIYDLKGGINV